ncbi:putative 28S ribosomal protein S26, mitochondrial [Frankliniella fusca]|uniref:Small ribosomal subunit protein mS26 n=1 Tax=Frankliniella fusca TaxID=407009 RepID=A0AAE1LFY4_9NEOP|nr:putative 28S ribosomal protein S26, mitochondrial [Frankliniella fusca]
MLRSGPQVLRRAVVSMGLDSTGAQHAACLQQTRGLRPRKPFGLGLAKSKWFILPRKPDHAQDEWDELDRLEQRYKHFIESISQFCIEENLKHAAGSAEAGQRTSEDDDEWAESLTLIKQWNEEVAAKRNERLAMERKAKEEEIQNQLMEAERLREQKLQEIEEYIRKEKELSKTYITPENIDKAIEECLEKVVDYNWAMDARGQKYVGRYVTISGEVELPVADTVEEDSLPPLFQSSPSGSSFRRQP